MFRFQDWSIQRKVPTLSIGGVIVLGAVMASEGGYDRVSKNAVRYFRPVVLTETCLLCHGDPATSQVLWGNAKGVDATDGKRGGWKVGEVHGRKSPLGGPHHRGPHLGPGSHSSGLLCDQHPVHHQPLKACAVLAEKVQRGFLIEGFDFNRKDEVGQLASALNSMARMQAALRTLLPQINEVVTNVTNGSSALAEEVRSLANRSALWWLKPPVWSMARSA